MAIKQFFALVVLGATATSFSIGVDAHRRSVKKSIMVYHFSSLQKKMLSVPSETDRDQAMSNLLQLKADLSKEFPLQPVGSQSDPVLNILAQTVMVINTASVDTLMQGVRGCFATLDRTAPSDVYGNYIWPATLCCMPIAGLSAVACGVFGEMRAAVRLSVLAGISLIGVLAQAFSTPYYEAWKKNSPAEAKVAEAHEFGKHFLYAITALKEGRLEVTYKDTIATVVEYDRPAKS